MWGIDKNGVLIEDEIEHLYSYDPVKLFPTDAFKENKVYILVY